MSKYPNLFSPLKIGQTQVRNRIVSTAHGEHRAHHGLLTDQLVQYHERRAIGGAGLLIVFGSASISPTSAHPQNIALWEAQNEDKFRELADRVHRPGTLLMAQATHRGPRETPFHMDMPVEAPSALPGGFPNGYYGTPHVLNTAEIEQIVVAYADVARRLECCGWDGIEITAFGTHLPEQFWSPILNKRTDRYGGDFEGRMRFSLEVLQAVDAAVSRRFLVSFRISADLATDMIGLNPDDLAVIARRLDAEKRIDLFNVSGGSGANTATHAAAVPTDTFPVATYNKMARELKSQLSVPILVAGRMIVPAQAEAALARGDCDLTGMTRALIADPDVPLHAKQDNVKRIRPCIAINEGCRRVTIGMSLACSINPAVADVELDDFVSAKQARNIAVIGGGPAGMEAARVAAQRGHKVILYEQSDRLGGQMHGFAAIPGQPHLMGHVNWLIAELPRLGVTIKLKNPVSAELLATEQPDAVIVATGAYTAMPPEADGLSLKAVTDEDVMSGHLFDKDTPVFVFDMEGRLRGAHSALAAARQGVANVSLIFPHEAPCALLEPPNRPAIFRALAETAINIRPHQTLLFSKNGALRLRNSWNEQDYAINEEAIVVFAGYRLARGELGEALAEAMPHLEMHVIGDCRAPRLLRNAVAEGVRAGATI